MKKTFEKSIYAKRDIDVGEKITLDNISFLKPLSKIHSSDYRKILNKKVKLGEITGASELVEEK